jgi:hypothetical protein
LTSEEVRNLTSGNNSRLNAPEALRPSDIKGTTHLRRCRFVSFSIMVSGMWSWNFWQDKQPPSSRYIDFSLPLKSRMICVVINKHSCSFLLEKCVFQQNYFIFEQKLFYRTVEGCIKRQSCT